MYYQILFLILNLISNMQKLRVAKSYENFKIATQEPSIWVAYL